MSPDTAADLRARHLEMVQSIVTRMSGQSASLKGYCLTISTAIAGVAITFKQPAIGLLAIAVAVIFAALDSQYLCFERRFRALFEQIRAQDWTTPTTFDLSVKGGFGGDYWAAVRSWSVSAFYLSLGVVMLLVVLLTGASE